MTFILLWPLDGIVDKSLPPDSQICSSCCLTKNYGNEFALMQLNLIQDMEAVLHYYNQEDMVLCSFQYSVNLGKSYEQTHDL